MTQPQKSEIKKICLKICLMGASGVGKTSLVKRFVEGKFDETYRTTIGVHIYKKSVICDEEQVELVIWDLEGQDDPRSEYPATYLDGAQGYMLVADVTCPDTLDVAKGLRSTIMRHHRKEREKREGIGAEVLEEDGLPFVLLLNKQDILQSPTVTKRALEIFDDDTKLFKTSAKLDENVDQSFNCLIGKIFLGVDVEKALDNLARRMVEVGKQKSSETNNTEK